MNIQEKIREDLKVAMKAKKADKVSALRYVLGEFKRLKGTKFSGKEYIGDVLTDEQAVRVISTIIAAEKQVIELTGQTDVDMVNTLSAYLPQTIGEEEVVAWLKENVDFSTLKNKMQAIGLIKKAFGSQVDAALVSKIITTM